MNDGGPTLKICIKCFREFELSAVQKKARDYRCSPCKRLMQNALNLAKGDSLKEQARACYKRRKSYWVDYAKSKKNDPIYRLKKWARRKVYTEIESGRLKRGRCEVCNKPKADAHHHRGYERPLDIKWLCRRCHFAEEKNYANTQSV